MFVDFFLDLRKSGVHTSMVEWMTLVEALAEGLVRPSLDDFYAVARAILVKSEADFDRYDEVFLSHFGGTAVADDLPEKILSFLDDPRALRALTAEERKLLEALNLEDLRRLFEERLREQRERHDGGSRWIGTGGTSPFGHGGYNPAGIRVGGEGGGRSAVKIASRRRFRNYRSDVLLGTRQMQVALRKLRLLARKGIDEELDVDESVDATCRNAGELELCFRPPRKNQMKLILLMDAGGSMSPHTHLVSQLFSAAHAVRHFKDLRYYYFHNCVYEQVFTDIYQARTVKTSWLTGNLSPDYRMILVGDAFMAPSELLDPHGAIDYWHNNEEPGLSWLRRLRTHFERSVWLNPIPAEFWAAPTISMIRSLIPMFPLTLHGVEQAVKSLRRRT